MIRIVLIILICILSFVDHTSGMKIRYRGSGGIEASGDKYKICPNKADEICAEIEGSLWDFIKHIFSTSMVNSGSIEDVELTVRVYGNNSISEVLRSDNIRFIESKILSQLPDSSFIEMEGKGIELKIENK